MERKAKEDALRRGEELVKQLSEKIREIDEKNDAIRRLEEKVRALDAKLKELSQWDEKRVEELRRKAEELKKFELVIAEKDTEIKKLEEELKFVKKREERLKGILERDLRFRVFLILQESGKRSINELSKSLGLAVVQLKTILSELRSMGLIELNGENVSAVFE
ncbi:MAG: hypothetical protein QXY80_01185 [Candidatus Jordarchaeales archaeon]